MAFTREKIKDFYLLTTDVENIFINEYMPEAPGDYVKVYLYGLLYSQREEEMTLSQMARHLSLEENVIDAAWDYWEKSGVVKRIFAGPPSREYDIQFNQLREAMYGFGQNPKVEAVAKEEENILGDEKLKELIEGVESFFGKTLSPKETAEIFSWHREICATSPVIYGAVSYCSEKGKTGIGYMTKVIRQWTEIGLKTEEDVNKHIASIEQRYMQYKKILQSLGLNRGVTDAEKEIIDKWFNEMKFSLERILEACCKGSFIPNPNIRYVNGILEKWYEEAKADGRDVNSKKTVTQAEMNRYYEFLRKEAEEAAQKRREEVHTRIPRIKEVDRDLLELGKRMSKSLLTGDIEKQKETRRLMSLLEQERTVLLTENNYREDYTDIKYTCDICKDTGMTDDGKRCPCTKEKTGEAELWLNSSSERK